MQKQKSNGYVLDTDEPPKSGARRLGPMSLEPWNLGSEAQKLWAGITAVKRRNRSKASAPFLVLEHWYVML